MFTVWETGFEDELGLCTWVWEVEVSYRGSVDLESSLAARRDCLGWGLVSLQGSLGTSSQDV